MIPLTSGSWLRRSMIATTSSREVSAGWRSSNGTMPTSRDAFCLPPT
jgi:hypothetical protein